MVTIPNELAEQLNLMNKRLIDFDIKNVFQETEKIFDDLFNGFGNNFVEPKKTNENNNLNKFRQPLADLKETETDFIALFEIPGVDKKDIQLNLTETQLEIKVEKRSEVNVSNEEDGYIRSERIYSGFYRTMNLPSRIISERTRASYKNGVLEVIMPKAKSNNLNQNKISIE